MKRIFLLSVFGGIVLFLLGASSCPPRQVVHVPADQPTIQDAINAVDCNNALILIADGVYKGPGNKNLHWDASTKHIEIKSENGPDNCIIDCENDGRAFNLSQGQNQSDVIDGLTIRNGWVKNPPNVSIGGGAILCNATSPIIRNCILKHNIAGDRVAPSSISYLTDGGAIECVNGSRPIILKNRIEGNFANHTGGGIHFANSSGIVDRNFIIGNINRGCYGGGGIALLGLSNPRIINNVIAHNVSEYYSNGGYGGGIICMNSNPFIINNTIVYNSTKTAKSDGEGGGIRIRGTPLPIIANCIISNNQSGQGLENMDFQYPQLKLDISYCDIEGGIGNILTDYAGTIIDQDPQFVGPINNNFALMATSPCKDSGTPNLNNFPAIGSKDLAGNLRISGTRIDIGAYEYQHQ